MSKRIKTNVAKMDNEHHRFKVWAPEKDRMILHIVSPADQKLEMKKEGEYFLIDVPSARNPLQYYFQPDGGKDLPDRRGSGPGHLFSNRATRGAAHLKN